MNNPAALPKPVSYDELYPGRFIKAADLKGARKTLKISAVDIEWLEDDKGKRKRGVVSFSGIEQQLALNRTNGECLKGMFGRDVQDWVGKRVTLCPVPYTGNLPLDITECIRIYGSPDIASDMPVTVRLPRKKPITMTMRKVLPRPQGQQPQADKASTPKAEPAKYDEQTAMQALREAGDVEGIDKVYADVRASFPDGIPLPVEALWSSLRESMQS